jgi:hypothetical protein
LTSMLGNAVTVYMLLVLSLEPKRAQSRIVRGENQVTAMMHDHDGGLLLTLRGILDLDRGAVASALCPCASSVSVSTNSGGRGREFCREMSLAAAAGQRAPSGRSSSRPPRSSSCLRDGDLSPLTCCLQLAIDSAKCFPQERDKPNGSAAPRRGAGRGGVGGPGGGPPPSPARASVWLGSSGPGGPRQAGREADRSGTT